MRTRKYKLYPTGIYAITCTANGKIYIGQTRGHIKRRVGQHFTHLKGNYHSSPAFQNSYNKYGKAAFEYELIEEINPEKPHAYFTEREQYWIDTLDTYNKGFNACPKAEIPPTAVDPEKYGELTAKRAVPSGYIILNLETNETFNISNLNKFCKENGINYGKAQSALYGANNHICNNKFEIRYANDNEAAKRKGGKGAYLSRPKSTYIVTYPDGKEEFVEYIAEFCRDHGLNHALMIAVAKGNRNHHKQHKCRYVHCRDADKRKKSNKEICIEKINLHFEKHPNNVIPTSEIKDYIKANNIKGISGQGNLQMADICRILEIPKPWYSRRRGCYCLSKLIIKNAFG